MRNLFKQLRQINPDQEFINRSRREILATVREKQNWNYYFNRLKFEIGNGLNFAAALALTALLIYGVASTVISRKPHIANQTPDFNIELRNAKYYKEIAPNVYIVVMKE